MAASVKSLVEMSKEFHRQTATGGSAPVTLVSYDAYRGGCYFQGLNRRAWSSV